MKRRQIWAPVLCAALLMTALSGTRYTAKADEQEGEVEEILLIRSQDEEQKAALTEVFRTHGDEGEKSEQLKKEALKDLKETSDTAVLIFGRDTEEEKDKEAGTETEDSQKPDAQAAASTQEGNQEGKEAKPVEETKAEETETESIPISESQQKIIEQVAGEFEQVVVVFNNYRPYGLEMMNEYASIKTVTMIETSDEEEMLKAARLLVGIVSSDTVEPETAETESPSAVQPEVPVTEEEQPAETEAETQREQEKETPAAKESETAETSNTQTADTAKKVNTEKKQGRPLGDVNGDGKIDSQDAAALMQLDGQKVTEETLSYADVTGDGKLNKKDVKQLLKYISGEIAKFEVEEK